MSFLSKIENFYEHIASQSAAKTKREKLQLIHFLVVVSLSIVLSILFIGYNFINDQFSNVMYVSLYLIALVSIFILIKYRVNVDLVYNFLNLSFITLIIMIVQNQEIACILWIYIYPLSVIFLFGTKKGIMWSFLMLISVFISVYVMQGKVGIYTFGFMVRFVLTYLVSIIISAWFNYYKELYYNELENINKILQKEQQDLEKEINERKALEVKLTKIAHTDSLTNLFNRRYFWELGNKEIIRSQRYNIPMCLAVLDIDYFKDINDNCGHPIGDEVLRVLSRHCSYVLRESDILGRIGGDEFAFILVHVTYEQAYEKFESLRKEIASLNLASIKNRAKLTVSIGVAPLSSDVENLGQLYKKADKALYEAKKKGRNMVI